MSSPLNPQDCTRCLLHKTRKKVVVGRGVLPCKVLFVGEAPGKSEDCMGRPFIGPSGRILDAMIESAVVLSGRSIAPDYYITNCVRCRPCDEKDGSNREPTPEEMFACSDWLRDVEQKATPQKIVLLGKVAAGNCKKMFPGAVLVQHPAYILRSGGTGTPQFRAAAGILCGVFREVSK